MPTIVADSARRRCPDERPQQILDAALEIFGERGLAGARLEDIARRAGIAKGTIYLYFPNKEELFREVVRHTVVARFDDAERDMAPLARESAAGQLRAYLVAWWGFACTDAFQQVYRLIMGEMHRFPEFAEFWAREVVARSHRLVGGIVARGVAAGEFRPIDPAVATRLITGLVITQAFWATRRGPPIFPSSGTPPERVRDQVCEFVFSALRPAADGSPIGEPGPTAPLPAGDSTPDADAGALPT